jgi:hypothetical protein
MFILSYEIFAVLQYDEMNCNLVMEFFYNVFWSEIFGHIK